MSNGLCPFAKHLIVPVGGNDPAIKPRIAILHVDAGNASSLHGLFLRNNRGGGSGIEAHFHVRKDGVIEQYRSIYRQADANYKANDFAVSIETQGYGAGTWNAAQIASIKRLLLWLHEEAGIPLSKVGSWSGSGVGYHTLFGAPGKWTPVAKSCPGPDRKRQFDAVLVPWMREANKTPQGGKTVAPSPNPQEEDDMASALDEEAALWYPGDPDPKDKMRIKQQIGQARGYAQVAYQSALRCEAAVTALAKALGPAVESAVATAMKDATVRVDVNVLKSEAWDG